MIESEDDTIGDVGDDDDDHEGDDEDVGTTKTNEFQKMPPDSGLGPANHAAREESIFGPDICPVVHPPD